MAPDFYGMAAVVVTQPTNATDCVKAHKETQSAYIHQGQLSIAFRDPPTDFGETGCWSPLGIYRIGIFAVWPEPDSRQIAEAG